MGLLAIVNPFSTALVFLGISRRDSKKQKKKMIQKACIVCFFVLSFFLITGSILFELFSITIEAFQIGGGLLISLIGFNMLYPKPKQTDRERKESVKSQIFLLYLLPFHY